MGEVEGPQSKTSDMSEDEIIENSVVCELEQFVSHELAVNKDLSEITRPEKRCRVSSDEIDKEENNDNDGFIMVKKKQNKRFKESRDRGYKQKNKNVGNGLDLSSVEVCVSSIQLLPKQIGLAKLLKAENIPNVSEIKYKTPYKVFMKFESRADAVMLVNNDKFRELGYKCRLTNEVSLSYGVVKYIELDMKEEELTNSFKSEVEIVSVKRLKRMNDSGGWSESETVRFCFKTAILPQYVYGYDCRFQVEPYTFPVTQCSVCWKYGHMARMCPSRKTKCPKCSGEHANCEITEYRCINCKGNHMAFYKKCPVFLKEKALRQIMCKDNCTYKMALSIYFEGIKATKDNENQHDGCESDESYMPARRWESTKKSCEIVTEALIHSENSNVKEVQFECQSDSEDPRNSEEEYIKSIPTMKQKKTKKKGKPQKKLTSSENLEKNSTGKNLHKEATVHTDKGKKEEKREKRGEEKDKFRYILSSLENIVFAGSSFEEKLKLVLKLVLEEIMNFVVRAVSNGDIIRKLMNLCYDG
ncbi:reverse transcriptase [Operophtera brumata]|uniref:Reverse transcriptase n=1 Tax=Operophtera brumata TaxID=104452 RepID=A0A0L7KXW1_OPEBR|nr:reverse transcriptase [Operophtera brumata]